MRYKKKKDAELYVEGESSGIEIRIFREGDEVKDEIYEGMRVLHLACGGIRRERRIEFEGESLVR